MIPSSKPPIWDMTSYFDRLGGEQYTSFKNELDAELAAILVEVSDAPSLTASTVPQWVDLITRQESLLSRARHLSSYLGCLSAADSRDPQIQKESAGNGVRRATLKKIDVVVQEALRDADEETFALLLACPALKGLSAPLTRRRERAKMNMSREMEMLAADLRVDGLSAWSRLYDTLTGEMTFTLPGPPPREVPMSWRRSLLESEDADERKATLLNASSSFEERQSTFTAALNHIAGTRLTLCRWRGVEDVLEPALFDAAISKETLDAMLGAIKDQLHLPQRFFELKAKWLKKERLGMQDLTAPLPLSGEHTISWDAAREHIVSAFSGHHQELGDFAQMAFDRQWIEAEPREGKRPGAFCSTSTLSGESRVFMSYMGTSGGLRTLAHELGHAFHGWVMRDQRHGERGYPMTLAETASIFAESVLNDALLRGADITDETRVAILDARLNQAAMFMMNIPMRFHFERNFYKERKDGEVSTTRLKELMIEAQVESYGGVLDPEALDPWFWASKLHFFLDGFSFYNFPYSFGYLFSLGVFERAKSLGPDFFPIYKKLLRATGSGSAEDIAKEILGVDLSTKDFWLSSMKSIQADLDAFEALTAKLC